MPGLDHAVIVARDLGALAEEFEALGFTLTPVARHPWGTANRLAQFEGRNFLELLTVDRPEHIAREPVTVPGGAFSFGRHAARFLADREGCAMVALATTDTEADLARWRAAGLVTYAPFHFERQAVLPGGAVVTVAFSLAFTTHPDMPDLVFFTCRQHAPEHFWKPAYQQHVNAVRELVEVLIEAPDPARLAPFFSGLTGSPCRPSADGIRCEAGSHRIVVRRPHPVAGMPPATARIVGLGLRTGPDGRLRDGPLRAGGVELYGV